MTQLEDHPLADLFPLIDGRSLDDLVQNIREVGLREPIVLFESKILDGRNRYRACLRLGIEPHVRDYAGADPLKFVISVNLHRRHLNDTQRAMVAAKVAGLKRGYNQCVSSNGQITTLPPSIAEAGEMLNSKRSQINSARAVLKGGTQEEIAALERGEKGIQRKAKAVRKRMREANELRGEKVKKKVESSSASALPLRERGRNPARAERLRRNARLWKHLKAALDGLTQLPSPAGVVLLVRQQDAQVKFTDKRLLAAFEWLEGFKHAWNGNGIANGNGDYDAGYGGKVTRTQPRESSAEFAAYESHCEADSPREMDS